MRELLGRVDYDVVGLLLVYNGFLQCVWITIFFQYTFFCCRWVYKYVGRFGNACEFGVSEFDVYNTAWSLCF